MLRLLECALALDKHRNFARAAEHLGISQPTLTRSIQELERQIGAKLFDRSRRGVEPTPFGAIVLNSARRVSLNIAELKREIALLKGLNIGELTFGVGPIVAQTWMGDAVGGLLTKHPMLRLRILDLDWWDIRDALHERRIDLAIGESQEATEDPDIVVEPLPHRSVCFYCRIGHPLQRLKKVTIREIGEYPLVAPKLPRRANEFLAEGKATGQLARGGHYFEPRIECQNLDAIIRIVRASDAVSIATAAKLGPMVAARDIALIPFQAPWLRTNYAVIHLRERTLAPAAVAFCAEVAKAERRYNEVALPSQKRTGKSSGPR